MTILKFALEIINFVIALCLPTAAKELVKPFNDYVLEAIKTYPTDGSEPYAWVNEPDYFGISRDLEYLGQSYIKGDDQKRSYCSGMTFQVFLQAYNKYNADHGLDYIGDFTTLEQLEDFRLKWYGVNGDRRTIKHALESSSLGLQVTDLSKVEAGDFVQLWRSNGSGHTVIFINWIKDNGQIIGIRYWSSNNQQGPGYREEYFGESGNLINMNETFFMKIIEPARHFSYHT